jgi:hypothetical protein
MSLRSDIYTALTTGGGLTAYPDAAPQNVTYPVIVFQVVAGHDEVYLDGYAGLVNRLVQIDAYANDPDVADALIETIKTRLGAATAFRVAAVNISGADSFDDDAKMYRASREFSLWANA